MPGGSSIFQWNRWPFTRAESVVVKDGQRLLSLSSKRSTLFVLDWNLQTQNLATRQYRRIDL